MIANIMIKKTECIVNIQIYKNHKKHCLIYLDEVWHDTLLDTTVSISAIPTFSNSKKKFIFNVLIGMVVQIFV